MREAPTHGLSIDVAVDDDRVDAAGAGPVVALGLVLVLPLVLFSWLCVAVDVVSALGGVPGDRLPNQGIDVFAAVSLTALFALVARALPPAPRAMTPAGR